MLAETQIHSANDLISPGEKTVVVFTRGLHLNFDENGNGTTGNWYVFEHQLEGVKKVIIYRRYDNPRRNEIFLGNFESWFPHEDPQRFVFTVSGLELKSDTPSSWVQFGGVGGQPVFFIGN